VTTALERQDECASKPEVVITLIHGTFAQGAAWVSPGSALRAGMESAFGNRIVFHRFKWSGDNTVYARKEAGDELAEHVKTISAAHPGARQILVAHSHGGNVALYALRDLRVNANVVGIACIATPFLHAGLRDERIFDGKTLQAAFGGLWLLGVFLIYPFISIGLWEWIAATTIGLVISIVISGFLGHFLAGGFLGFREFATNLAQQIDCRLEPSTNLFIVRKVGDEASLALGASQFFSWAATKAFAHLSGKVSAQEQDQRPLRSFTGRPLPKAVWALWLISLVWFIASIAWTIIFFPEELPPANPALPKFFLFLVFVATTATLLVKTTWLERPLFGAAFLGLAGVASVGSSAFGTNAPRSFYEAAGIRVGGFVRWLFNIVLALSIEINAEATPAGRWVIRQFERTGDECRANSKTLVHSAYNDPAVIDDLIRWIATSTGLRIRAHG
jgi:hypothetical protein